MVSPSENPVPRRVKRGWMNLKVVEIIDQTHDTKTFFFEDAEAGGQAFDYNAGQYLTFRYDGVEAKPVVRSYTMSSSPAETDRAAVTVKRVDSGLISNWMCDEIKVGTVLRARGPIGKFCYFPGKDQPWLLMVAGGSGVTPFISIMREYASMVGQPGAPDGMVLLVAHRSQQDLICQQDIEEISKAPNCKIITSLTREDGQDQGFWQGRPDKAMMHRAFAEHIKNATIMTCGPVPMMNLAMEYGREQGLEDERIKMESFE